MPARAMHKSMLRVLDQRVVLQRQLSETMLLHSANAWLFRPANVGVALSKVLKIAMNITDANFGNVQLFDAERETLKIAAHHGFHAPFLEFFDEVHTGGTACGAVLQRRERVFVRDVTADPIFQDNQTIEVMLAAEARAVRSFPLVATSGRFMGVLSTHYRSAKSCTRHQILLANLLATNLANFLERGQLGWAG